MTPIALFHTELCFPGTHPQCYRSYLLCSKRNFTVYFFLIYRGKLHLQNLLVLERNWVFTNLTYLIKVYSHPLVLKHIGLQCSFGQRALQRKIKSLKIYCHLPKVEFLSPASKLSESGGRCLQSCPSCL